MQGQKLPPNNNKKSKKKNSMAKKKPEVTFKEEYVPSTKTPCTLPDYIPKSFFGNDSSDDDNTAKDVEVQFCMVLLVNKKK